MNKMFKWSLAVVCAVVSTGSVMAQGDGGPLIDALVKKGVLSSQEGEEIRADMLTDLSSTPGGMISWGSSAVRGVRIYGDARMRYQYDNEPAQVTAPAVVTNPDASRSRYRYRVRLGADYTFAENWRAGVRLETAAGATSTNSDLGGYFDKTGDEARFGLVFLQYSSNDPALFGFSFADSFDLRLGKHAHPFYVNGVNGFLWDTDANPEGASEQIGWTNVGIDNLDITLRGGQYLTAANDTRTSAETEALFVAQIETKYEWASKSGVIFAPMLMAQTEGVAQNGDNLDNLLIFAAPAEVYFNVWTRPLKLYGTIGMNLEGEQRTDILFAGEQQDNNAILANLGFTYGSARNKGGWSIGAEYRYIESGSANPQLLDSDFNAGLTNAQGIIGTASYAFTDNITGTVSYFDATNINENLTTRGGIGRGAGGGTARVLQVDLSWRF